MTFPPANISPLQAIMARLRNPGTGCEWDIAQTFETIAPYTIEEAYEVADACQSGDMDALKDELGDLLLQVVFHSRMAEEMGAFSLQDVIVSICEKMVRRHPHVFSPQTQSSTPKDLKKNWEAAKAEERAEKGNDLSALAGVARALPALQRAEKLQKRAARQGFDWDERHAVRAKVLEELDELDQAQGAKAIMEESGDLLFATVNFLRHHSVEPEHALRCANDKFERRFRQMEAMAGDRFKGMTAPEMEELWRAVKALEMHESP